MRNLVDLDVVKHCRQSVEHHEQRRKLVGHTSGDRSTREGAALPTAAQKNEFRRMLVETRARRRLSQRELGKAAGVSKAAVSQWEVGRSLPVPANVPNLERALEVEPGTLSRLLGYLPITSGDDNTTLDVIEAIRQDS